MRPVRVGRPMGEISQALLGAARQGPATVRELAARGCVGFDAARLTAPRLVKAGALVPLTEGRPRVLALPKAPVVRKAGQDGAAPDLERFFRWAAGATDEQ